MSARLVPMAGGVDASRAQPERATLQLVADWLVQRMRSARGRVSGLRVKGHAMSPTFIDGDVVLIDEGVQGIEGDGLYALLLPSGARKVQRVQELSAGDVLLLSDNPSFPAQRIEAGQVGLQVLGRVIWPHSR